ncbi:hypothetical protein ACFLWY_04650 [Chloroflexota bacterium]
MTPCPRSIRIVASCINPNSSSTLTTLQDSEYPLVPCMAIGTDPATSVTMDSDKEVTACFCLPGITLIGAIWSEPSAFDGAMVTVKGEYRGWEAGHGSPPVTRSDWGIQDASGSIYVTGSSMGLRYPDDVGKIVTVSGIVRLKDDQPYIEIGRAGPGPLLPRR